MQPGMVIIMVTYPDVMHGHIEEGQIGVNVVVDIIQEENEIILICSGCGSGLDYEVERILLTPDPDLTKIAELLEE